MEARTEETEARSFGIEDSQRKNGGATEVHYTRMRTESYCKATKEISEELPRFVSQEMFIFPSKLIEFFYSITVERNLLERTQSKSSPNGKKSGLSKGQKKLKKRHEKSVVILVLIVTVFVVCHSFRLGVQTYQVNFLT